MKNTIIKILATLSAVSILFSMAACGKTEEVPTTTTEVTVVTTEEPTVMAQPEPESESETIPETTEPEETTEESDAPQSKAEILACLNEALNAVKSNNAGFKKVYKRDATGDIEGLPGWLKDIVHQDETSTSAKGKNTKDTFPAAGYTWSSHLRESDVKACTLTEDGDYYNIRVDLGTEKNPEPGEASHYGRVMSVVTVSSAESIPGISNVSMDYHDGYVTAKIEAKTGKVVACEFSAAADVSATVAILGNISVKNIVSTETFTDFVW